MVNLRLGLRARWGGEGEGRQGANPGRVCRRAGPSGHGPHAPWGCQVAGGHRLARGLVVGSGRVVGVSRG